MNLEYLYLIDGKKHLCQHWASQRPEMVDLIHRDVCIINEKGDGELRVCSADILPSPDFEKRIGCTSDPALWDSLISNYNSLHPDEPLIRWV